MNMCIEFLYPVIYKLSFYQNHLFSIMLEEFSSNHLHWHLKEHKQSSKKTFPSLNKGCGWLENEFFLREQLYKLEKITPLLFV